MTDKYKQAEEKACEIKNKIYSSNILREFEWYLNTMYAVFDEFQMPNIVLTATKNGKNPTEEDVDKLAVLISGKPLMRNIWGGIEVDITPGETKLHTAIISNIRLKSGDWSYTTMLKVTDPKYRGCITITTGLEKLIEIQETCGLKIRMTEQTEEYISNLVDRLQNIKYFLAAQERKNSNPLNLLI